MIFHTVRTIKIGDFSEMLMFKDMNILKRFNIWMPKRMVDKAYIKLIEEWNTLNNSQEVNELIEKNGHKLKMLVKLNLHYKIMLHMFHVTAMYNFKSARKLLIDVYKYVYNKEPKTAKDYEKIVRDYNLKVKKYKQMYGDKDKKEVEKEFDFEKLVINIENILSPMSIRDKKLYTLPNYIEMAAKRIKENGRN